MLITNFKNEHIGKVAFKAKRNGNSGTRLDFVNNHDGFEPLVLKGDTKKEVLVVMDCKIVLEKPEVQVDDVFEARYTHVKKALEEEKKAKIQTTFPKTAYNTNYAKDASFNRWEQGELWDEPMFKPISKKNKSIMEMTDAEFKEFCKRESEGAMGQKEAFITMNFLLEPGIMIKNSTSPFDTLKALDAKFKTVEEMDLFTDEFAFNFGVVFYQNFPEAKDTDYIDVLNEMAQWLYQFKHIRLFHELHIITEEMLDFEWQK